MVSWVIHYLNSSYWGKPYIELRNWHGRIHLELARLGDEPIAMAAGKTWNVTMVWEPTLIYFHSYQCRHFSNFRNSFIITNLRKDQCSEIKTSASQKHTRKIM